MLNKIDKYILKNFLGTFVFLLGAFSVIAIVIDFTEKINDFVDRKVPISQILIYFKNFIPYILALLFPIFIFVAVIFFTSKMANRSELIAILSSGMSFKRMLRPYIIGAAIISLALLLANHYVIPKANKSRLKFEEKYLWERNYSSDDNFHIRISQNEYIYMQSYNPESKTGYRFSYEKLKGNEIIEKISADRCTYDSIAGQWKLQEAVMRNLAGIHETLDIQLFKNKTFAFKPADLIEKREAKQMMTTPELNAFINKEKQKGSQSLNEYLIEFHRRTSSPFSAFVLSIIGACIASRKVRGGSGVHLAVGLMISAIYIFLMQFSTTFAIKGNLHPLIAVWIPNFLFGLLAIYIYRKYSK
ncbi:MAG: LptF/LptG family permease [Bacteroidetes bacterium]|jgi:lipopolysaccharide export system permease protein|nr:LptF/LptG family permease [Bacteroidota bacterium]HQW45530.1 LptF/LptG family permease [Chitinophagaceae bacterium]MBK6818379.1 LptF/LptG family permease [Bacteroidota bacterium]MBK7587254.1 LptF/LptG family permease [Bacteroidota bacterium]MBK8328221.1 LptF/LptG family permease [Bacteroidota bacterium]